MNVAEPFLEILAAHPHRLAVGEPNGRTVSYHELRGKILALSQYLIGGGLRPGDRAVLQIPSGIEFTTSILAVLLAGGVPVLAEPALGDTVYRSQVGSAEPLWLLGHPLVTWVNRVPRLRTFLRRFEVDVPPPLFPSPTLRVVNLSKGFLDRLPEIRTESGPLPLVDRDENDLAAIVFTGGTTQAPKGVLHTHLGLDRFLGLISEVVGEGKAHRFLTDTPQQVLFALRLGCSAFVTRGRRTKRARAVWDRLEDGTADAYFGSPHLWSTLMDLHGAPGETSLRALKTVIVGSAPVDHSFFQSLEAWLPPQTRLLGLYGLTEAGPVSVFSVREKVEYAGEGDLVGEPLPGVRIEIEDLPQEGRRGTLGEVVVHSPALYKGYLGQAPRQEGEGLRTGDLGRIELVEGRPTLILMGRKKDMIIRRGVNIYPSALEASLCAMKDTKGPLLKECALVGVWNEARQDEELVLFARPVSGREVEPELVHDRARTIAGEEGAPDHVILTSEFPVIGRQNKVDKAALRRLAKERVPARTASTC